MGIIYSSCAVVERDYILGNRGGTSKHWERRGMGGIRYVTWDKLRYMGRVVTYVAGVGSKAKEQRLKRAGVFGSLLLGRLGPGRTPPLVHLPSELAAFPGKSAPRPLPKRVT